MVQKPFSIAREDFIASLTKAIKESGLPAVVMLDIMAGIENQLKKIADAQLAKEQKEYKEALQKEKKAEAE